MMHYDSLRFPVPVCTRVRTVTVHTDSGLARTLSTSVRPLFTRVTNSRKFPVPFILTWTNTHMGECSTMSMVTQRSVERYARGSFLFTAFLEKLRYRLGARVYCQCKVGDILSPLLTVCQRVFASLPRKWSIYYLAVYLLLAWQVWE